MKAYTESRVNLHAFLSSAWNWGKWSASHASHFTLRQRSLPPQNRMLVRPHSQSGHGSEYIEKTELILDVEVCRVWIVPNLRITEYTWTTFVTMQITLSTYTYWCRFSYTLDNYSAAHEIIHYGMWWFITLTMKLCKCTLS